MMLRCSKWTLIFIFENVSLLSNNWKCCWNVSLIDKKGLSRKEDYSSLDDTSS